MSRTMTIRSFLRFLMSSTVTIVVLAILFFLLTGMGQGLTIIVDLFYKPANLFLTVILINFLALILSHFPYYFDVGIQDREHKLEWKRKFSIGIFGIVYHTFSSSKFLDNNVWIKFARRHTGVLAYSIWFYILNYVGRVVFNDPNKTNASDTDVGLDGFFIIWNLIFLLVHIVLQLHQRAISNSIKHLNPADNYKTDILKASVKNYLYLFQSLFVINLLAIIGFILYIEANQWSQTSLYYFKIITSLNALLYIVFRVFRSWFVYFFNGPIMDKHHTEYLPRFLGEDFRVWTFFAPFKYLASTPNYLAAMSIFGFLFVVPTLCLGTFTIFQIECIHPIALFIILVIFYYSAIVITLKHYIYYRNRIGRNKLKNTTDNWMAKILGFGSIALVFLYFSMQRTDNDLHTLQLFPQDEGMSIGEYSDHIDSSCYRHIIIGSYGGGLKANLWNMLLLDALNGKGESFLQSTVCMSGVSGGAIGLANFTALCHNHPRTDLRNYIEDIGVANMLSTDIFGWLFKDFWREAVPKREIFKGRDRSWASMRKYIQLIPDKFKADSVSVEDYWLQTFKQNEYFPAVIFNTTPTVSQYGVACTIDSMSFPISIDILDHGTSSLSFFGAASTTNRFPIFSPTARIPSKGHFVDGGYFENSGLMNAYSFYNQLGKQDSRFTKEKLLAVNIINDKSLYILKKLKQWEKDGLVIENQKENHLGELSAILGGIVALERMPRFIKALLEEEGIELQTIDMPYTFCVDDVIDVLNVEEIDQRLYGKLESKIRESNNLLIESLRMETHYDYENWKVVEPPLGRLMSLPAVRYQMAMINHHPEVIASINKIIENSICDEN